MCTAGQFGIGVFAPPSAGKQFDRAGERVAKATRHTFCRYHVAQIGDPLSVYAQQFARLSANSSRK